MPTTYSPLLRLSLIGNGEQAGTWGTTTNTNLGTLLDTAIAGNVTVSITATAISPVQALTAENGVNDQSRQSILTLTGGVAAFSLYAPPVTKQYIVFNNTSYDCSFCNSSVAGGTTPAAGNVPLLIPAGRKLTIFSDATSFRTIDSSGITGILAVANGGTGVAYSTGSSAYTGTGVVLSTTPTITSPTLITQAVTGNSVISGALSTTGSTYLNGTATGLNYVQTVAQGSAVDVTADTITLPSALYNNDMVVLLSSSDTLPGGFSANTLYYVVNTNRSAVFSGVGSISGTTLTINSVYTGAIGDGTVISGTGVTSVAVTGAGAGGGAGTYPIAGVSQTVDTRIINGTYSGAQSFKLSTSLNGAAVGITSAGSGNLTLTPVSIGITAPAGTSSKALATCEFVGTSNPFTSENWTATETVTTQSAAFTSASPTVITVASAPATGTAVSYSTTGTLPSSITANAAYYVYNISSTTYNLSTTTGTSLTATIAVGAIFTASISATAMTVTAVSAGAIAIGQTISGTGVTAGTTIVSGAGTSWVVSVSQTVSSTTITATSVPGVAPGRITVATAPANGDIVNFATTGALPTGLTAGPPAFYYVVNRTSTTFQVSATLGGTAIVTSGTQSGTQTATWRTLVNTTSTGSGITETTSKLVFRYKSQSKFSIDLGGNMIAAGRVTAFGTP